MVVRATILVRLPAKYRVPYGEAICAPLSPERDGQAIPQRNHGGDEFF